MNALDIAGWVAPAATMIAACMTAANLGARITGFGFVVFAVGSIAWTVVAVTTSQQNLLWTNGFLLLVNAVGIWRWLGRQARYEEGSQSATAKSAAAPTPALVATTAIIGRKIVGQDGAELGKVVEAMMRCDTTCLVYLVISEGGLAGVGERLRALPASKLRIGAEVVESCLSAEQIAALPVLSDGDWPATMAGQTRPESS